MATAEQKDSIVLLPIQQRVVAVALKHLFDQIRKVEEKQDAQIQKVHQSFFGKTKSIEQRMRKIVSGAPIQPQQLVDSQKYFTDTQRNQAIKQAKQNKGLEAYWGVAIINFFGQDLTLVDKQIATAIKDIQTNVEGNTFEVIFDLGKNDWLQAGKIHRKYTLDAQGSALKTEENNQVKWLKPDHQGIFNLLLRDTNDPKELEATFEIMGNIINQIVPYSLQYYLGMTDEEESDLGQDQQQDQDEDDQQEQEVPSKKVKK